MADSEYKRTSVLTEVRAWLIVAATFVAQLVTSVWWAATLSSDMRNVNINLAEMRKTLNGTYTEAQANKEFTDVRKSLADHEFRLRTLEYGNGSKK